MAIFLHPLLVQLWDERRFPCAHLCAERAASRRGEEEEEEEEEEAEEEEAAVCVCHDDDTDGSRGRKEAEGTNLA